MKNVLGWALLLCFFTCPLVSAAVSESKLNTIYDFYCKQPSDINEHLPIMHSLAKECSSVTEMGNGAYSTWALLAGLAESASRVCTYLGIDQQEPPAQKLNFAKKLAENLGIKCTFWTVDNKNIQIEPTDLLFIDSLHTYSQLTYELETFSPHVIKYICMHDTSDPWEYQDDNAYRGNYSEYPAYIDTTKRGLWPAVIDFLEKHPEWSLLERRTNNHGLTILKRNDEFLKPIYSPEVDFILKNKIILCTGPALGNYPLLKMAAERDMNFIPFKKIFIATNDPAILTLKINGQKPSCEFIGYRGKQLDCTNTIFRTLRNAVNDPEIQDDDIILFKHETVYINDMNLIKKAIKKLLEGYDMVARSWSLSQNKATDAFFVKVGAVRKIVENYPFVTEFPPAASFCEEYFTVYLVNLLKNVYHVPYYHSNGGFTELGFYHIISLAESHKPVWDRSNYKELFK